MFKRILASIVIAFFIIGCGSPRIDTSSDEKMKASIEEIKKSLSDEKRKEFEEAYKTIVFGNIDINLESILTMGLDNYKKIANEAIPKLSNKTAEDIILEAKKIKEKGSIRN